MGHISNRNIQSIGQRTKVSLILLLSMAVICITTVLTGPQQAQASVAAVNAWPNTPQVVLNGPATGFARPGVAATGTVTVGAGTNRSMLVAVACEYTAAPGTPPQISVTYGTKTLFQLASNVSQKSTIWLGYLNEADLAAVGSGQTLRVRNNNANTLIAMYASAAVYSGISQVASPLSGIATQATASATSMTAPSYTATAQGANTAISLAIVNWNGGTLTAPTGYTVVGTPYAGTNLTLGAYTKTISANGTEAPNPSVSAATSGALVGFCLVPNGLKATVSNCADCHYYYPPDGTARNNPAGTFPGSHSTHAGAQDAQYAYACSKCHYNHTSTTHSNGFKNITGSAVAGPELPSTASYSQTKKVAVNNTPTMGTCSKATCHGTGRSNIQYTTTPTWGGTITGCLACHGGRSGANGAQANSTAGFKLSTTHSQHLKYPAANISCNQCHGKTASDAATLKVYTGVLYHANGVRDVHFADIAYGTYTSYKSTEAGSSGNTKTCSNTACHGGQSRGSWSNNGAVNNDHTCAHCHGTAGTPASTQVTGTNRYNLRFFAPGYKKTGSVGTSTDQKNTSSDIRVGSHFKHLSSAYMRNIKCNECHKVPSTPFSSDTNHTLNNLRFNSGTLDFSQSSSARILIGVAAGSTPAQLAAFAGYTNGTSGTAATCSSVYCHGNRLKNGAAGGSYTKPYWNYSAMINYTDKTTACGRCHGNPPTSVSGSHSGKTPTTSCSGCHSSVVNATGVIINKDLHINGRVEAAGGHAFPYPGATHSVATGATNPSANCSCHDYTTAGTYPVASGTAPKCLSCHTAGLLRTASTSSCYDCHGASATDGMPNSGTTFPNWSGSHTTHVTGQGMACTDCHSNGGTGNTAHGNSNAVAKTRTTVNVQQGGTATFTYTAASQQCSNVSCHGTATWSVTQFDCVSCHGAALNGRRQITGTGGDFARNSHHVTSGTLSKWHCIICHAEGNTSTGGTTTLHKNGSVELRNVDTPGNPGTAGTNYWSIPNTKAAADYTNIDTFCFKCHDAVGSASVAYNGTAVITTGLTATQQQKPFNDNLTNAYDGIARTRVTDVDTQFTTTNYSHHAVKAAKYTAAGGLPFNTVAILQGGNVDDNSRLHCHDCHILNGHGTANEYLLQNSASAIGDTDATLHAISSYVCLKCHTSTYSTTTHTGGNGSDFVNTAGAVGVAARAGGKTDGNITGISCTNCHNVGGTGWGGIHGGNNTYTQGGGGTQNTYRFMPGMNNNGYTVTNWTAASSAISCYTNPTTNWGVCTSHTGGKGSTVNRVGGARALSY